MFLTTASAAQRTKINKIHRARGNAFLYGRIRAGECQFVFLSGDIFRGIGALHGCRGESSTEARLMSRALAWRGHSLVTVGVDFSAQLPLLLMLN